MNTIWIILQVTIGYNLIMPFVLYMLYLGISKKGVTSQNIEIADYGIIVTAYEQINTLQAVVSSILAIKDKNFIIYLVADKCDITNLKFNDDRVLVLRPPETLGSNTRSHFYALNNFKRTHNRITIIDSDNLVDSGYLNELDFYFDKGFEAVQGVRLAKNLDTTFACLDAARDIYYHFYDGKILFNIGSSATLAGSGMAFTTELYKDCLKSKDIQGAGFDKVLQYEILKRRHRIAFADRAIVYDEKTSRSDQLVNQRARWINTWFKYFKFGFDLVAKGVKNRSINQFVFGLILLRPPLFIFLILSVGAMFLNFWISITAVIIWAVGFLFFITCFLLALRHSKTDPRIYASLINIPKFMFYQILSLLRIRKANKISVATTHYHSHGVDNIDA